MPNAPENPNTWAFRQGMNGAFGIKNKVEEKLEVSETKKMNATDFDFVG